MSVRGDIQPMGGMTAGDAQDESSSLRAGIASMLVWGGAVVGIVAAVLFLSLPQLDLATSGYFYVSGHDFYGTKSTLVLSLRDGLLLANGILCTVPVIGLAVALYRKRPWLRLSATKWLFLGLCFGIGPGLVSNLILKDHWGRARPVQIAAFGGTKAYTPPLIPTDQCPRNCSFVSGEPSTIFVAFFALAFLFPAYGRSLVAAGIASGLFAGWIRIAQGGHFLSDVIYAGVVMAFVATLLYWIFEVLERERGRQIKTDEHAA